MELLFVILISAAIGIGLTYASGNGRRTYGSALIPAISAAVTTVVWIILLLVGFTFDGTWIWVISLIAGPLVALIVALRLPRSRENADRALLAKLSGTRTP